MDEKHADIFQATEGFGFWLLKLNMGTSLVVQWLRILLANARDVGLIPGQETTIPHVVEQLSPHAELLNLHTARDSCAKMSHRRSKDRTCHN